MRSIVKKSHVITLSWILGFELEDLAPHLVALLNKDVIKQWVADWHEGEHRVTLLFPGGKTVSMRPGDRVTIADGKPKRDRVPQGTAVNERLLMKEHKSGLGTLRAHLYSVKSAEDLVVMTACYDVKVVVEGGKFYVNGAPVDEGGWVIVARNIPARPLESWETDETLMTALDADEIVDRD